ncbi:MAG: redoxin domain-containing protein [Thermoleophilia bacterium]|nr:redoxin domain-containing protein [Thermoleophilia bacterium]
MLLRDRSADLAAAGIRVYGLSLDSPWSQRAFAESLTLGEQVKLLSDARHEAAVGLGVLAETEGPQMARRSVFLVRDGTVVASWLLETPDPDIELILDVASRRPR